MSTSLLTTLDRKPAPTRRRPDLLDVEIVIPVHNELLVLAQRRGLRIHEVPVDWVEDRDSRVEIVSTALADLRGVARLLVHRPPDERPALPAPRRPMLAP